VCAAAISDDQLLNSTVYLASTHVATAVLSGNQTSYSAPMESPRPFGTRSWSGSLADFDKTAFAYPKNNDEFVRPRCLLGAWVRFGYLTKARGILVVSLLRKRRTVLAFGEAYGQNKNRPPENVLPGFSSICRTGIVALKNEPSSGILGSRKSSAASLQRHLDSTVSQVIYVRCGLAQHAAGSRAIALTGSQESAAGQSSELVPA